MILSDLKVKNNVKALINDKKRSFSSENFECCFKRMCEKNDINKNLTTTFEKKLNAIKKIIQSHTNQLIWIGDQVF